MVFIAIAFLGTIPLSVLSVMVLTQWLVKSCYEALVTPLTYVVVGFLKRREGVDVYDLETRFNPLFFSKFTTGHFWRPVCRPPHAFLSGLRRSAGTAWVNGQHFFLPVPHLVRDFFVHP